MIIPISWLKRFLEFDASVDQVSRRLTSIGFEVESVLDRSSELKGFVIAEIVSTRKHPDADKLKICNVFDGSKNLEIVCGASNAREGIKVVLASVGTIIPNGKFEIKASKIRGVHSEGMLCSESELLISGISMNTNDGIIELSQDAIVGQDFASFYELSDPIIEISVTPNRGDVLSILGVARELSACGIGTLKLDISASSDIGSSDKFENSEKLIEQDTKAKCIYFQEINGVKNLESPLWLKNHLRSAGIKSISAVVDITNYVLHSFGQPLHAYDKKCIDGELKVCTNRTNQDFVALDGKTYKVVDGDITINDNSKICSLAGIIGSKDTGCEFNTTDIILEAAVFDPISIFKTGNRLKINTQARMRFERFVDATMSDRCLSFASKLILEICGGNISNQKFCVSDSDVHSTKSISVDLDLMEKIIGIELNKDNTIEILGKLGFALIQENNRTLDVSIPFFRNDIKIVEDIAEEIVRYIGYDNILPKNLDKKINSRSLNKHQKNAISSRRVLSGMGYDEVINFSFVDSNDAKLFSDLDEKLRIINPISAHLDYMRSSVLIGLLSNVYKNQSRLIDEVSIFEIGPVFLQNQIEFESIGCLKTSHKCNGYYFKNDRVVDFYDVKGDVEVLLSELGINRFQMQEGAPVYYHQKRSASISLGKTNLGYIGQIHPSVCEYFGIKNDAFGFELFLDNLPETKIKYGKINSCKVNDNQIVRRDFAFLFKSNVKAEDLINFIKNIDKNVIKSVSIFDIYKHNDGNLSIAVRVVIQSDSNALLENEIHDVHKKIIDSVTKAFECEIRFS